jgi:hypothetical protein
VVKTETVKILATAVDNEKANKSEHRFSVSKTRPAVQLDEADDGTINCDRVGTVPFTGDCKKFVKCVIDDKNGFIRGRIHTCPHTWSFDPVFGICRNTRSAFACPN